MPSRKIRRTLIAVALSVAVAACARDAPPGEPTLTDDPEALAAYEAADTLWTKQGRTAAEAEEAAALLVRATELDPDFVMAQAYLAQAEAWIHQNWGRTSDRADRARAAAERAVSLAPDLYEAQAALATYYYRIPKDYEAALEHYTLAAKLAPGEAYPLRMTGYVARRAGQFERAVELLEEAAAITETRSSAWDLGNTYLRTGRYDDTRAAWERARELEPEHWQPRSALAWLDVHQNGDLSALRAFLDEREGGFVGNRWWLAMVDGEWEAAVAAMDAPGADPLSGSDGIVPRSLNVGLAYRRMGDETRAMESFQAAREMMENMVAEAPDDPRTHLALGLALAALGMPEEAIAAGRRGVELLPPERDAMIGPSGVWWLAEIYAAAGETDMALEELERLISLPHAAGLPTISMDPWLYELADHPGFNELLEIR